MTLGQNIQTARKAKGISQEALAEKIGVSRQALGKWEKDTALPGVDNLQALAKELGVSVDALLGSAAPDTAAPAVTARESQQMQSTSASVLPRTEIRSSPWSNCRKSMVDPPSVTGGCPFAKPPCWYFTAVCAKIMSQTRTEEPL